MCGRVTLLTPPERLASCFGAVPVEIRRWSPRYNVAPGADLFGVVDPRSGPLPAVVRSGSVDAGTGRGEGGGAGEEPAGVPATPHRPVELRSFRWGVRLPGGPGRAAGRLVHNARSETVASRQLFATAYRHHRIVVPVDGFFEWERRGKERQPYYFVRHDGDPLALAGLWVDTPSTGGGPVAGGEDPATAEDIPACVVVTAGASADMAGVHDRMPVILERDGWEAWLDPGTAPDDLAYLLGQYSPAGVLVHHPVDRRMGATRVDDPGVIEPLAGLTAPAEGTSLVGPFAGPLGRKPPSTGPAVDAPTLF
ncbi:MAG: SOS response-associated peptidase [Actinomycetota bacterium]|nr:SOS response-associated peptidase [Actinomycetota bacterium]